MMGLGCGNVEGQSGGGTWEASMERARATRDGPWRSIAISEMRL
jgi:hypothetical protein